MLLEHVTQERGQTPQTGTWYLPTPQIGIALALERYESLCLADKPDPNGWMQATGPTRTEELPLKHTTMMGWQLIYSWCLESTYQSLFSFQT